MEERVPHRRALALLFGALLSPLVRIVPVTGVKTAGQAGWLAPVLALPLLLLALWLVGGGLRRTEGGLGGLYRAAFGEGWGRAACGLSAAVLWVLFCGGLRFYGERFVSTMYPGTGLGMFFTFLLLVLLWMRGKGLAVWARAGQIFFYVAILVQAAVLALAAGNVKSYHVLPVWTGDIGPAALAALPIVGTLSCSSALGFLTEEVALGGRGRSMRWCAGLCLVLTVTGFVTVGFFGPGATEDLQVPFFSLAKEAGIPGALERLESVVSCVWVFVDLLFLGIMMKGTVRSLCTALRCGEEGRLTGPLLLAALPGGWLIARGASQLEEVSRRILLPAQLAALLLLPIAAAVTVTVRQRRGSQG